MRPEPHFELMQRLSRELARQKDAIIEDWQAAVQRDGEISSSEQVPETGLIDHLPALLDALTRLVAAEEGPAVSREIEAEARVHGTHRWKQGYHLGELLRELSQLRRIIVRRLAGFAQGEPRFFLEQGAPMLERIHLFLDETARFSTECFVEAQQRALRAANEARSCLVLRVVHELRNVLNHLSLVATEYELEEGSEAATQMRTRLAGSTGHMTELLDELQELSALSAGRSPVRVASFPPERLVRELAAIYRPLAEAKGLELWVKTDPKLTEVRGDERKTYQILANLVSNAIKYTERGEVCVEAHLLDGQWTVSVRDTGVGIAPEEHASIFSEFYRVERTAGEKGLGLGLSIVGKLLELLKGEIAMESAPGQGSRFLVTLPVDYDTK